MGKRSILPSPIAAPTAAIINEVEDSNFNEKSMKLNEPIEESLEKDKINSKDLINL
jgi:hypothetical protein